MSHDSPVVDGKHIELDQYGRDWFFEVTKDWKDPLPPPQVIKHDGVSVVRDDFIIGSKARFADLLVSQIKEDTLVYVSPRVGLAGVSLLDVASRHNKKVVLFMPSSKRISHHQACTIEMGAVPIFKRIAAMPNLNRLAKIWAEENNGSFIPLGLKHPLVVACIARIADDMKKIYGEPDVMFVATSTGVLVRGLQIGFPNTKFFSICVSRNMQAGELGRAEPLVEPLPFQSPEKLHPAPFPTVNTYDAKCWKYAKAYAKAVPEQNVWMWNVGAEPVLKDLSLPDRIDSYRDWSE